jgi:hypothetical protein
MLPHSNPLLGGEETFIPSSPQEVTRLRRTIRQGSFLCKNLAWWMEKLPTMAGFHNLLPLLAWNAVYILRGLTEERPLRADPAYRVYCDQVRYRFVPGVW